MIGALSSTVARIDLGTCLAWTGSFCTVCYERCPVPEAIWLEGDRPVIDESRCTGCGECVLRCPGRFGPSVHVVKR